jgi:glycosyltransferase involved in cell wall biosynthesis
MKVIILCTQLEAGGAQRASLRLSQELISRDISCENWFLYKKRDNFRDIKTIRICQDRPIKSFFDYIPISIKYYRMLRKERPDVVITFTHYANVLGGLIAFIAGVKIRIASHRNPSWGDYPKAVIKIDKILAETGVYSKVTAVSNSTKQSFRHYRNDTFNDIVVVNNGLNFVSTSLSKAEARHALGLPISENIVGTVGRLSTQKNQQVVINAIRSLPDVHFVIVGDGELREEIKEQIKLNELEDRVHLLGEIEYKSIPLFLKSLDIYVMPSLFEGLSNALVEAMSAGLPVITSDVDAQKDVVISEDFVHNGIILPPLDTVAWTRTIDDLLSNREQLETLSKLSLKRASQFTIKKMADGFLDVIHSVKRYK